MTCAEAEPLLPLVADGALDPEGDPALFAHLSRCTQCQDALARHDLVTLALERGQPAVVRRPRLRLLVPVALAAAAALALAAGLWWWTAAGDPPPVPVAAAIAPDRAPGRPQAQAPEPAPALASEDPRILRSVGRDGQVRYLIQHPDRVQVVDLGAIDGAGAGQRGDAVPVRW